MRNRMGTPYSELQDVARPVNRAEGHSNFFSAPQGEHDPRLFEEGTNHVRPEIRQGVLELLYDHWGQRYIRPREWSTVWIAGSALSSQWSVDDRGIGDLDILIGIDMPKFYAANPSFRGFSEELIAKHINAEFYEHLQPRTKGWLGKFDTTFYVNPGTGTDIRAINPYAAYNLTTDAWTVAPPDLPEDWGEEHIESSWWDAVNAEIARAEELVERYDALVRQAAVAPEGPRKTNLFHELSVVIDQISAKYETVHRERRNAFQGIGGVPGEGFEDYYNFRWQMFKRSGIGPTMNEIRKLGKDAVRLESEARYGAPISANVLTPANLKEYL